MYVLDPNPVDLAHLGQHQFQQIIVGQVDDEIIDGDPALALDHLDAHHVAADGTDAAGHRSESTRSIGQPYAKHEPTHEQKR